MFQLKKLTEINSVSGNENAIRKEILNMITPYATCVSVDTMGNIIAFKKGTEPTERKVMIAAHMDEVGFIVSSITDDGFVKFKTVGGIDERILLAQHVTIGENKISGVIGIKAVHLQGPDERTKVVKQKDMYIDIGASDKDTALKMVKLGDYISFDSDYTELGGNMIKAKALDDRAGCALLCELIKNEYKSDLYFCFSVQEEVGLRGSSILSRAINADIAIVLEGTTCSDIAGLKPHEYATVLGRGPVISIMDRASYSNKELNKFITYTADKQGIKFQYKQSVMGGNDAGSYQRGAAACKTAVISLPCRYIHSPVSCANTEDLNNMYCLANAVLEQIQTFC